MDRNFDDLADRFKRRVYGGLKGKIRLAVLSRDIDQLINGRNHLKILDIGAGLGQFVIALAEKGHDVHYCDLSESMLHLAEAEAERLQLKDKITWHLGPYQKLAIDRYDLILCYALLEWVDKPESLIGFCADRLKPGGQLSLNFYNPAAKVYRNLIRGNFDWLDGRQHYIPDSGSLTPRAPCSVDDVQSWLKLHKFQLLNVSGVRVFHDYVVEKRGGLTDIEAVVEKELEFSDQEPYRWLGRYLHFSAQSTPVTDL